MDLANSLAAMYLSVLLASQEGAHQYLVIDVAYFFRLLYQTNPVLNALGKRIPYVFIRYDLAIAHAIVQL